MIRLTGSGLDRADVCPGSLVLPQRPHDTEDSASGRDVHAFLDAARKRGRGVALGALEDPDLAEKCAAIDLDSIPAGAESEVALAYDPDSDTTERLTLTAHRAYPDDGRICMTLDLVGVLDGAAWVADIKTGKAGMRAQEALQIRAGCLAVARLVGADEARGALLYLRHDGSWHWDRAHFDSLDLDAIRDQLIEIRAGARNAAAVVARGGIPQLVPGIHCEHCAAASACPVQERQQAALVARPPQSLREWFAGLDEADAGRIAEQAIVVAKIADKVREAADARAEQLAEGLALPSGRRLKRVAWPVHVMSPTAKDEISALRADLRERGEITIEHTWQVRVTGRARKG